MQEECNLHPERIGLLLELGGELVALRRDRMRLAPLEVVEIGPTLEDAALEQLIRLGSVKVLCGDRESLSQHPGHQLLVYEMVEAIGAQ